MHDASKQTTTHTFSKPGSDPNKLDVIGLLLAALLILGPMAAGALHLAS
jgi:hypothetical protein